jgi:16S rRNA (guanine(966)-N(2))-methyltransferase RsmD
MKSAAPKAGKNTKPVKPTKPTRLKNEVRIIGGLWRRTRLPVADKPGLRPTPDRVRETLFNWLASLAGGTGGELPGWHCFDVFAGTGALGFEAASRGAAEVTMC